MNRIFVVARHEFVTTVKRVGFLVVTFGLPLFMAGLMALTVGMQKQSMESEQRRIDRAGLAYVDEAGVLPAAPPAGTTWRRYASIEEGRARLAADRVEILIRIPADYVQTGSVPVITTIRPSISTIGDAFVPDAFEDWLVEGLLAAAEPAKAKRARDPVARRDIRFLQPDGSPQDSESLWDYVGRLATAGFFFVLTFLSISVAGGYLVQGLADEKENRVLEMVISSITPVQLMAGKLLGLGAVGLLQVAVWSAMGIGTVLAFVASFALNPGLFAFCLLVYLLGYLLVGSLLLGIGSLGSNQREAMQYTWVVNFLAMSPLFFWFHVFSTPHSAFSRVLTFFPLTAPATLMIRVSIDPRGLPAWEVVLALGVLAASTVVSLRLGARLYRAGLLLYGKRPTPREIWRWIRA